METIVVFGLGLIGGSMALALKNENRMLIGVDNNETNANKALELGIVNRLGTLQDVANADVVIVAVPVNFAPELTLKVLDLINPKTLVFDVGSVKSAICKAVKNHPKRINFVAAHPIAGTEYSGPEAAFKQLFINKKNIICESNKSGNIFLKKALNLFDALQMTTTFMEAKAHDRHIAYVSHLSHISSFMLGKTVLEIEKDEKSIFTMAGSGFASTVRLSKSSPSTWTPIFIQNKDNILKSLEEYIKNLNQFKELLKQEAEADLYKSMKSTHHLKNILSEIK
ncbi:MAG: prephenate dehydrogenase [Flavobacteriales bacterium]|jgi:prephenate dehydrogenase|nr:prephenate dehydrogenase [Flavobacteriales bacterium]